MGWFLDDADVPWVMAGQALAAQTGTALPRALVLSLPCRADHVHADHDVRCEDHHRTVHPRPAVSR